jgi:hypothetical protein
LESLGAKARAGGNAPSVTPNLGICRMRSGCDSISSLHRGSEQRRPPFSLVNHLVWVSRLGLPLTCRKVSASRLPDRHRGGTRRFAISLLDPSATRRRQADSGRRGDERDRPFGKALLERITRPARQSKLSAGAKLPSNKSHGLTKSSPFFGPIATYYAAARTLVAWRQNGCTLRWRVGAAGCPVRIEGGPRRAVR